MEIFVWLPEYGLIMDGHFHIWSDYIDPKSIWFREQWEEFSVAHPVVILTKIDHDRSMYQCGSGGQSTVGLTIWPPPHPQTHRHWQRLIIVCLPPWLTDSQCRSFYWTFHLSYNSQPTTHYVNGVVRRDTRKLGPFVAVCQYRRDLFTSKKTTTTNIVLCKYNRPYSRFPFPADGGKQ